MRRVAFLSFWTCLLMTLGCRPALEERRSMTLEVGEISVIEVDAVGREQTITASVTSTGGPLSVSLYLAKDDAEVERAITLGAPSDLILARQTAVNEAHLAATIPAGEKAAVRIESAGREAAQVQLIISNQSP